MGVEVEDNWSLPLFVPIKPGNCEICGELHAVEKCTLIDGFTDYVRDSPSLSYARLTLPEGLEVRELSDGTRTIVASKPMSKGSKFGPFVAKTSALIDVRIEFPLKVFLSADESVYLETYEETFCNWMCLVLPASCAEEQNLICFQIKTSIYFCSLRDIKKGDELRVWYAPYYANQMGAKSFPKPADLIHSSDEEFQEIFESLQNGIEMQDHEYVPKVKKRRKPPKKLVLGENYYREVPPSDVLPGELLGAVRRGEWECSTCGQVELNVAAYARHLMTHFRPPLRPSYCCPHCNRSFKKDGYNRLIHIEVCQRKKLKEKESTLGETLNQSAQNRMSYAVRTVEPHAGAPEIVKDSELPLDNSLWSKSVICDTTNNNSDQIINQSIDFQEEKGALTSQVLQDCKTDLPATASLNKSIGDENNEWSITKQDVVIDAKTENLVSFNSADKNNITANKDKNDGSFEQAKHSEESSTENLMVKSHLNTPILDLSDDIYFNLNKSLEDMVDDHSLIKKDLQFAKNRSLDLFNSVESDLVPTDVPPHSSTAEAPSFYSLEKNGFLQSEFVSCTDVTDEERNRIVENLLSETDGKFFASDYEMTDGCVSDNNENQAKVVEETHKTTKHHQSETGGDFKCDICYKCFTKPVYLYRHLRKHTGEFRCNTCFMVFARKENLVSHRMSCPNEANTQQTVRRVRIFCKFCRLQFHSLSSLQDHMGEHYCTGTTWKCRCKMVSDNLDLFLNHTCPFNSATKTCTKCENRFKSPEEFVEHTKHPVAKVKKKPDEPLLCEFCGVMNLTITGARLHRKSMHGEKIHECSVCGKKFSRSDRLTEHMDVHISRIWECSLCPKSFPSAKQLRNHKYKKHKESFTCPYCDKEIHQKSNFERHVRFHERKYDCQFCDLKFTTLRDLKSHLTVNHIQRLFKCDKCEDVFSAMWQLKTHSRRVHHEHFKCPYCKIEIRYKHSLKRHLTAFHEDRIKEWEEPNALMKIISRARKPGVQGEGVACNNNPSINEILQTVADDAMEGGNLNVNDNIEQINNDDTQNISNEQMTNTNFVTEIFKGNVSDVHTPQQEIKFDINVLHGSDNVPQLVSIDGEVLSMPLTFVSDLTSSSIVATTDGQHPALAIDDGTMVNVKEATVSCHLALPEGEEALVSGPVVPLGSEEDLVSCPVVLPEGYFLTLDNTLNTKQLSEDNAALINVSDYQAVTETTSGYVLTTGESVAGASIQPQNNVLFYIVDTSVTGEVELHPDSTQY